MLENNKIIYQTRGTPGDGIKDFDTLLTGYF